MKPRSSVTIFIVTALLTGFGFVTALAGPARAAGQQTPGAQALEIAPPVLNLSADPGQTLKTKLSLRNISNGPLVVTGELNDFIAAGEDGTPKILTDQNEPSPFSMRSWFAPLSSPTLKPRQIQDIPLTIRVPANAAPGGYYSVVRFTGSPPELEGTGVSLSASLGALLLVRVNGQAKESVSVESFSVTKDGKAATLFEATPLQFTERLRNGGNVHEQPAGQVIVTDMFGKTVAGVNVNLPPRNILPQSVRKFDQTLDKSVLGNRMLFGRYRADLTVTYGASGQKITSSLVFWVIPYKVIGLGILALLVAFFLLRLAIRRYNRHIISKAQRR